jgi:hypothetical protein
MATRSERQLVSKLVGPPLQIPEIADRSVPRSSSAALLERVDLPVASLDVLTAAVLMTSLGVFLLGIVLHPDVAVLRRSLPIAATCFGLLGCFCGASRLMHSPARAIAACFGLLLITVFGPQLITVPATIALLIVGFAYTLGRLRLRRSDFTAALGMAAVSTATIVLAENPYTSFDMIERLQSGSVSVDTLYHASMSAMIKNYGVVSTGLNGLVATPYHALSHALFAAISLISGAPVIEAYGVATSVLFAPLLVFATASCGIMQSTDHRISPVGTWVTVCVLLTLAPAVFGPWALWDSYFASESYLVSLILFLLILPLLSKRTLSTADYVLLLVLTSGVSTAKASVGLILVGLFGLRLVAYGDRSKMRDALALALMAVVTAALVYDSAVANSDTFVFGPLHFIERYSYLGKYLTAVHHALQTQASLPWRTWLLAGLAIVGFIAIHFVVSWAVVGDSVRRHGLAAAFVSPTVVYSLGAVAAALAIVFLYHIFGGSAYYFTNVAFFVSLPALAVATWRLFALTHHWGRAALLGVAAIAFLLGARAKWTEDFGTAPPAVVHNALIAGLLEARRTTPREWVLKIDTASTLLNPFASCRARQFVFPAVAERPVVWPEPGHVDCLYIDYGYESYQILPGTDQPSVPLRMPRNGRIVPWSAAAGLISHRPDKQLND